MDKSKFNIKKEWQKFGIGLGTIFLIIASMQFFKQMELYIWFAGAGILTGLVSLIIPVLLKPLFILFSYLGFGMNWMMTRIMMMLLFYLVLTPISILSRLFGKSYLNIRKNKSVGSYWTDIQEERNNSQNFERQF